VPYLPHERDEGVRSGRAAVGTLIESHSSRFRGQTSIPIRIAEFCGSSSLTPNFRLAPPLLLPGKSRRLYLRALKSQKSNSASFC
jgi:hypothetical protein